MTIVQNISPEEFNTIEDGKKSYIIIKMKNPPQLSDRLLLQVPELGKELELSITHIEQSDHIFKGYYLLSFCQQVKGMFENGREKATHVIPAQ